MTPKQRKQLAAILLKEGEDGWRVEIKHTVEPFGWFDMHLDHIVDLLRFRYRAIRTERVTTRTPLPVEHYKRGMEVATDRLEYIALGYYTHTQIKVHSLLQSLESLSIESITKWRWPNETEWKPAYTETVEEREVEVLTVDGL